jgi:hypothetical protein
VKRTLPLSDTGIGVDELALRTLITAAFLSNRSRKSGAFREGIPPSPAKD